MAGPGRWVPRQADLLRLAGSAEPQRVGVAQLIQASRHVGEVIVPGTALRVTSGRMDRVGGYAVGAGACGQGVRGGRDGQDVGEQHDEDREEQDGDQCDWGWCGGTHL